MAPFDTGGEFAGGGGGGSGGGGGTQGPQGAQGAQGAQGNQGAQGAQGGTSGQVQWTTPFAFDHTMHAELAAGVLLGTLPEGSMLLAYNSAAATISETFDGSTPTLYLAGSQADAVAGPAFRVGPR